MPGMDGIEATRLVTAGPGEPRVVVLTTFDDDDYVYAALPAGASGFLRAPTARREQAVMDERLSAVCFLRDGKIAALERYSDVKGMNSFFG